VVNLKEINKKERTIDLIEDLTLTQELRPYLGVSQLGHSCPRFLWYSFRWCYLETFSARLGRLFSRGHREEDTITEILQKIGYIVYGQQRECVFLYGHGQGHIDGLVRNVIEAPKTPHLLEVKTMNDKNFKELCKNGVRVFKPIYFSQCQLYMNFFKLQRTLFVAINKNDDSIYIERIRFEKHVSEKLLKRAQEVILSEKPPLRPFNSTWYECRWCSANHICHKNHEIERNCRTCSSIDMLNDGIWECSKYEIELTTSQQRLGCKNYQRITWK